MHLPLVEQASKSLPAVRFRVAVTLSTGSFHLTRQRQPRFIAGLQNAQRMCEYYMEMSA